MTGTADCSERKIVARRCAFELPLGGDVNLGIGRAPGSRKGGGGCFRRDCVRRSLGKCSLSAAPWVLCFPGRRPGVGEDLEVNE